MDNVEQQDLVVTDNFDFTVEPLSSTPVQVVESIDQPVLVGMMAARCN